MKPTAVAIGMFDGVHIGHRFVLDRLKDYARLNGLQPAVVTFANHPLSVIRPEAAPPLICDLDNRIDKIHRQGIDSVVVLPFDNALRRLTAAEFGRDILRPQLDARAVLLGYDNGFGSDRLASPQEYADALAPLGIDVAAYPPYPDGAVSSSIIRRMLAGGDIQAANKLLAEPFTISGTVVSGRRLGRTIGFPTANIVPSPGLVLPASGVYAARVISSNPVIDGRPAMLDVGTAPTVNGTAATRVITEAHIILPDSTPAPDLYGSKLTLSLMERLRDEQSFPDLDALTAALAADRERTLRVVQG